jgi:TPR repeat protein
MANSSNINTLSALLFLAAKAGHTLAQYNLGCMLRDGEEVEKNLVKAVEWIQKGTLLCILKYQHT